MCTLVLKLELVSEVIVGSSSDREERLKALIYSAVYLKVSLLFLNGLIYIHYFFSIYLEEFT